MAISTILVIVCVHLALIVIVLASIRNALLEHNRILMRIHQITEDDLKKAS